MEDTRKIEVTTDPNSLYEGAKYLLGLYTKYTGQRMVIFTARPDEFDQYRDQLIDTVITERELHFKPKKQSTSQKYDVSFEHFRSFVENRCIISKEYEVLSKNLREAFSETLKRDVDKTHEFPELMKRLSNIYPIEKFQHREGTAYRGIALSKQGIPVRLTKLKPPLSTIVTHST